MERREVLELCRIYNKCLLDIGVGSLAKIAVQEFDCFVTNIDVDKSKLEKEIEKFRGIEFGDRVEFVLADAKNVPYKTNFFDVVTSYGALHHNPKRNRNNFIEEIHRVASNKICLAEFKEPYFPHDNEEFEPVNLKWLKSKLGELGEIKMWDGEEMILISCSGNLRND